MRRLIIGDIHAHYDMLRAVLEKASFDPGKDILYSVGDILDHGDKPVETLRFLMSLLGKVDIRPAGEQVELVPLALAMTDKN